ncbi:MAG: helix-turn-helix transcriptional regulator [Lachnospiraceae bacterium]|nr:helix-turn-helix transcriptional regulator [Lachnospiraceae bacterium]
MSEAISTLSENLQYYRKREEMTQEQLAERLQVSRQTISKWESGTAYPETEKLLQLCQIFSCSMDVLMRQNAEKLSVEDNQKHREHMEKRRKWISIGVAVLISSVAFVELLSGIGLPEEIADIVCMAGMIVGILMLVVQGVQHDNYKKKYPIVQDFYTKEEKETFDEKCPVRFATGIGIILIGLLIGMNGEYFCRILPFRGLLEDFYDGIFLFLVAIGVGVLTYTGLGKEKYDIEAYNKEENPGRKWTAEKTTVWCGCIMLIATILFMVLGFVFRLWAISWVVFPIGGVLCGIVVLILQFGNGKE